MNLADRKVQKLHSTSKNDSKFSMGERVRVTNLAPGYVDTGKVIKVTETKSTEPDRKWVYEVRLDSDLPEADSDVVESFDAFIVSLEEEWQ